MKLVLSHSTALDLVRAHRCGAPFQLLRTNTRSLTDSAHTKLEIGKFDIPSFPRSDERLHVLVPTASMLCDSNAHVSHLATYALPPGSLYQVSEGVFTVSPALILMQMSAEMDWLRLTLLGSELCGLYSLKPADNDGLAQCAPIAQPERIGKFVSKLPGARGTRAVQLALQWMPAFSASPMESAIYLLLTLPVRRGGYGMPKPSMNPPTTLGIRNARAMSVDELHCDLHWTEAHIALEYNSKDAHVGHLTRDALRANALTSEGERVFTMTPAILAKLDKCDALIGQIARELGHRLQGNALGMSPKRAELRARLFPWIA